MPYSVPSKINCSSLNKLVNELLQDTSESLKSIEFDFLIQGELLRIPLNDHLSERNISSEATIVVEYIERTPAPEPQNSILHDDWVSSIKTCEKWYVVNNL